MSVGEVDGADGDPRVERVPQQSGPAAGSRLAFGEGGGVGRDQRSEALLPGAEGGVAPCYNGSKVRSQSMMRWASPRQAKDCEKPALLEAMIHDRHQGSTPVGSSQGGRRMLSCVIERMKN